MASCLCSGIATHPTPPYPTIIAVRDACLATLGGATKLTGSKMATKADKKLRLVAFQLDNSTGNFLLFTIFM